MKRKGFLSIILSILILVSTLSTASAKSPKNVKELAKPAKKTLNTSNILNADKKAIGLKDSDEVRVIVELIDKPLVDYANEKGVKLDKLNKEIKKQLKEKLDKSQEKVKNSIKEKGIKVKHHNSFVNVANGFSLTTTLKDAKSIALIEGVRSVSIVNEYERPKPNMGTSKDIVDAVETWSLGYNGEEMVVAIIDTGVDPSHKDMVLTDSGKAKLKKEDIETKLSSGEFLGTWRTDKVPYGYNYMDLNQEILDLGPDASMHGMHVAGIVGANGDEENGGVKGIAPEAQLLAMKVFGNNPAMPSTFGDVIVKAIDDSVALGADVINMSLGSSASFVMPDDLEQQAVKRAMENGVICSISAGNSTCFGNGWDDPYTKNPDIGVVGSPGLSNESIQVAAIENTHMRANALEYVCNDITYYAGYINAGGIDPVSVFNGNVEYVNCGLGNINEIAGLDVAGKIALIQRGDITFVEKITNAQNYGAIGVIVYNSAAGGEGLISMAYPEDGRIPAVFIQLSHGLRLAELTEKYVQFNGNLTNVPNPDSGKMSSFTSWGSTPNLDFKPEITAPGGNIWSTAQNNGYQLMSGTSMAAPHVSGGAALVLQRVDKEFNLSGDERVKMAKNLLMCTAHPLGDKGLYNDYFGLSRYNFTSPRRQGAGVMDLYAATSTPAVAVEKSSGLSKAALGEIGDTTTFTLKVYNFSDEAVTYRPSGTVQTDLTDGEYNFLETQGVYIDGTLAGNGPNGYWSGEFPISFDKEEIEIGAGQSAEINVTIELSNAVDWYYNAPLKAIFENGTFIEGFISLTDVNDTNPTLNLPYMGFYGEWDKAPAIDDTNYNEDGTPFYGVTTMTWLDEAAGTYYFLGYDYEGNPDTNNIAFSPNRDGIADTTVPVLSFLRNVRELDINILDKDGNKLRDLAYEEYIRKNYHDGRYPIYTSHDMWTWDGTINNKLAADGEYIYEIKVRVDYPNAEWQTLRFPIKLDTKAPLIEGVEYDKETKLLTAAANDGENEIYLYQLIEKNEVLAESLDGIFDLSDVKFSHKAFLRVHDFANNFSDTKLEEVFNKTNKDSKDKDKDKGKPSDKDNANEPVEYTEPIGPAEGDNTIPTVMVKEPEFFGIYNVSEITFNGYINDESSIEYLKINSQNVPFVFNTATGNWDFEAVLNLEDGYHSINIEAKDSAGNEIAFAHKIFVDTNAPVIVLNEKIPDDTREEIITIKALITDNLPSLRVRVNGNMITNIAPDWSYFNDLPSASYELNYELKLEDGKNIIIIEAEDDAGNITVKKYQINRIKNNNGKK